MPDLQFLHGRHSPRCDAVVDKRFPDYCSLQMIIGGEIALRYDQRHHPLKGRYVFLSWPGPWIHFERANCPWWDHRYIAFKGPLMDRWFSQRLLPFDPQEIPRGDFVSRFDRLLATFPREDELGHQLATNLLESLILDLAENRRPREVQWLDSAKQLILSSRDTRPDYSAIAEELQMSLSHFRRRFRSEAGISVHQFLLQSRIEQARHLLSETQTPIKVIARDLRYRDVFFFSRQFAKLTGLPPAEYRAKHT